MRGVELCQSCFFFTFQRASAAVYADARHVSRTDESSMWNREHCPGWVEWLVSILGASSVITSG